MPKTFVLAAFFFLSATIGGCGLFSDADEKFYFGEKRQPDKLEYQYIALANEIHSVKPCYLIHSKSLRVAAFNSIGSQVSLLRSTCFSRVGKYSGNEQICDHVRSASTLLFSGADFSKDSCRQGARLHREHDLPGSTSSHLDVKNLVTLAGYKETDIDLYLVSEGRFSSVEIAKQFRENRPGTYWGEVQRNVLHSSDFFDRISDFPGFGTSEDLEKMKSVPWAPRHQRQWTPPEERRTSTPEFGVSGQSD